MKSPRSFEAAPQELIMTVIGAYVQPRTRPVWAGGLVATLGEFGFSAGAARVALTRLVARGVFDRTKNGRLAHYAITARAEAILAEGDSRIFSLGRTAGDEHGPASDWTVLWHTVPEDQRVERSRLTRRLRFLGFGSIQDGTWIAPRNHEPEVAALLDTMELRDHATVWIGQPATERDLRSLVTRIWDVDALDNRYGDFIRDFCPFADAARHALNDTEALVVRTQLVHEFRQFPFVDPELPESLVPPPPNRAEAVELFHRLYDTLAKPAQRRFDHVTSPPASP